MFGNVLGSISGFTGRMNPVVRVAVIAGAAYVAYKLIRRVF
jgi:hypothetical protein